MKAWELYKSFYDDFSVYGNETKGKGQNDLPYAGATGYDGSLLQKRTTDKGYNVMYDTNTGQVYYSGMTLPTGRGYIDMKSAGVFGTYILQKGYNSSYDITYEERQELLGTYNGD